MTLCARPDGTIRKLIKKSLHNLLTRPQSALQCFNDSNTIQCGNSYESSVKRCSACFPATPPHCYYNAANMTHWVQREVSRGKHDTRSRSLSHPARREGRRHSFYFDYLYTYTHPTLVSYIFASRRENLCLFLRNVTWCFAFHKSKMAALSQVKYSSDKGVGSGRGTHRYGRVKRMIMLIWSQLSGWHSDAGLAKFGGNLIVKMLRSGWPASAFY